MKSPNARLLKLLGDNNLTIQLSEPTVRSIKNGGIIIEQPQLQVVFTDPQKEEKKGKKE